MSREVKGAAVVLMIAFAGMLGASTLDFNDAVLQADNYCEMVSFWEFDKSLGVDPDERSGHPNYKSIKCN